MFRAIYRVLEIPFVYRFVTTLLGPGGPRLRRRIEQKAFEPPAKKVLDVGCGPWLLTLEPQGLLVGVDINEAYVRDFTHGFVDRDPAIVLDPPEPRRRLGYVASADKLPFADGSFDEIRSSSLFHHLPDQVAAQALREMHRCLSKGGKLVMFDMIWPKNAWTRPLAWLIVRNDRGTHVRTEQQLVDLFRFACPGPWVWERHTYTYTGLELLCLRYVKE